MRRSFIAVWVLCWSMTSAMAQVGIGIGLPGVSIGINLPLYPTLVRVPNYPVYYAPSLDSNFFFYDGMYWVYQSDNWYASSWYNGPWWAVAPEVVPLFVLRIPVRYYRSPPSYFGGWRSDAPPRWGDHWGNQWEQRRNGWDRWNRSGVPAPAPLPVYQRQYSGDRYPRAEQQQALQSRNYRYQPRDAVVRQQFQEHGVKGVPPPAQRAPQAAPQESRSRPQDVQRPIPAPPLQQGVPAVVPRANPPHDAGKNVPRSNPAQDRPQQRQENDRPAQVQRQAPPHPEAARPEPQPPRSAPPNVSQGKGASSDRGQGQEKNQDKGEEHGKGRN